MRIIIIATGSWGDVRPNVLLGHALQRAGYEVLLVVDEGFREWVEGRGLRRTQLQYSGSARCTDPQQ
jgi:UDP:flavonoid glycosyltransferase YjiC (YdhE family)